MKMTDWIETLNMRFFRKADLSGRSELTQNWSEILTDVAGKLGSLTFSTEQEFLDIGEKLQDFYRRSQDLSEMSSSVVDLMTGDEISSSTQGLADILEELQHHLGTSDEHFSKISKILSQYMNTLRKANSHLDEFKMLVLNLSMLGFFTRVENAHVFTTTTGFASLTDDVKKLSERINEKSSCIREESQELLELVQKAASEVAVSEKSQRDQARLMLENTISNHRMLEQKNNSATVSARLIADRFQGITESIGDIVSSLQFHDITRQQIEHVKEILDNLNATICEEKYPLAEQASIMSDVCSLQMAQLSQSQDEFRAAVTKITDHLMTLTQGVKEILGETQKVAWASDFEGIGFMEEIDSGITTVITCLDENSKEQIRLADIMSQVSEMVSEMSLFIQEIEYMGQNLQLIALNARIKAAHMGHEGAALDTISGGIYDLSKNSRTDTKTLADMLSEIADIAKGFDADLAEMQRSQKEQVQAMVENLQGIIASLHQVNERVLSITTDMNAQGELLIRDIQASAREITVREKVEHILRETQDQMEEMISEGSCLIPENHTGEAQTFLDDFDQLYTMQSEREVHMRHREKDKSTFTGEFDQDSSDELGENVELF